MKKLYLDILNHAFSLQTGVDEIQRQILKEEYFYLLFNNDTPFTIDNITLPVFLQENDAAIYVRKIAHGYNVKTMLSDELLAMISDLAGIKQVKFYSNTPIHITFSPQSFSKKEPPNPPPEPAPAPPEQLPEPIHQNYSQETKIDELIIHPLEQKEQPINLPEPALEELNSPPVPTPKPQLQEAEEMAHGKAEEERLQAGGKGQFVGTDKVREYFSILDAAARRKIDPGNHFMNIRTLVETLYQQNGLDPSDLDEALGFPNKFTYNFIKNITEKAKKDVVLKYLSFFGLEEYWLSYQDCCMEIKNEIKRSHELDQMKLRYPAKLYAERFQLKKIRKLKYEGGLIYRVTLIGETDTVEFNVTDPMKPVLKVDRIYQLLDGNGDERAEDKKRKESESITKPPSKEELADILSSIQTKKSPVPADQSFEQIRKNKIVFYLKDKLKLQRPSAESKYKEFECDSDILNEFYEYIEHHRFGKLEVQGYTARRLVKELKITEPYEAFHYLLELRNSPGETKQKLKLLEGSLKAKKKEAENK